MNPLPQPDPDPRPLDAWPRPSLTVDVAVLTVLDDALQAAVYLREIPPQAGTFALPGGFVGMEESLDDAARRVLASKVGIREGHLEQLHTFGRVDRDPRGRVVTVSYIALAPAHEVRPQIDPAKGAALARVDVPWAGMTGGPVRLLSPSGTPLLLFLDHAEILGVAMARLRAQVDDAHVVGRLLRKTFTLRELQVVHELIRGEPLNKDSFRRRILASGQLQPTGRFEQWVAYRPAELYELCPRRDF